MPAKSDPRVDRGRLGNGDGVTDSLGRGPESRAGTRFYRSGPLGVREMLPAIGLGVAAGFLAFYVAQVFLRRQPLAPDDSRGRRRSLTRGG